MSNDLYVQGGHIAWLSQTIDATYFGRHHGDSVNGLHKDLIEATAHVNAALAKNGA